MLPVSPDVLHSELVAARDLLDKWIKKVDAGIPIVDTPGDDARALEFFLHELVGELQVVSGKCDTLVEVYGRYLSG